MEPPPSPEEQTILPAAPAFSQLSCWNPDETATQVSTSEPCRTLQNPAIPEPPHQQTSHTTSLPAEPSGSSSCLIGSMKAEMHPSLRSQPGPPTSVRLGGPGSIGSHPKNGVGVSVFRVSRTCWTNWNRAVGASLHQTDPHPSFRSKL